MPDYRLECPSCGKLLARAEGKREEVEAAANLLVILCRSTRCRQVERVPVVALWRSK